VVLDGGSVLETFYDFLFLNRAKSFDPFIKKNILHQSKGKYNTITLPTSKHSNFLLMWLPKSEPLS
jgi:hypothetical protein